VKAADIKEAEQRLSELGYWTGPVDNRFDGGSRHALIAFQKVEGRKRTGRLTMEELEALREAKPPPARVAGYAHIEIDLYRQVLFIVDATGAVSKILPVSTGTGEPFTSEGWTRAACTPCGEFTVYRKIAGWRKSPLGLLYYPNYISGGVAIHGSLSVPAQPASHGCIRIPMFAAKEFSQIIPIGMKVIVHDGARGVD
jgi:lipoprotein-anchoring transpeptidase ErfK/SrfK